MKKALKIGTAVVIVCAVFVAGAVLAVVRGWGTRDVSVEIMNTSKQPISSFAVQFETCGTNGTILGTNLDPEKSKTVRFVACGEGEYAIEVRFPDGRTMKSNGTYVESGYTSVEAVTVNGIVTTQHVYAL